MSRFRVYFIPLFFLAACSSAPSGYPLYLTKKGLNPDQSTEAFQHCRGYGCQFIDTLTLTTQDWQTIQTHFKNANTPQDERESIRRAIGTFETIAGAQTGTSGDIHGTFIKTGNFQLDCVDESTNTSLYLDQLIKRGLVRFHILHAPTMRLPLIHSGRWPHQTALIQDISTNEFYAVDSWFHDNGHPAEIVPLKIWRAGWKPKETNNPQFGG